jgi:hypothetical protein
MEKNEICINFQKKRIIIFEGIIFNWIMLNALLFYHLTWIIIHFSKSFYFNYFYIFIHFCVRKKYVTICWSFNCIKYEIERHWNNRMKCRFTPSINTSVGIEFFVVMISGSFNSVYGILLPRKCFSKWQLFSVLEGLWMNIHVKIHK